MYQLRPLSLGEILDGAFAIYRRHFSPLVAIVIVCQGVPTVLSTYVELGGGIAVHPFVWLLSFVLGGLGGLVAAGTTVRLIADVYIGEVPAMGEALRHAFSRIVPLFIAGLAKYLLIALALLLFVLPGIVVACGYAVVTQIVILEDLPAATDALRRSWFLTRGYKGKALGLGFVLFVILGVPIGAAGAVSVLVPAFETTVLVGSQLFELMLYPLFACGFTLFYYDLRVRKDAFDIEHLSRQVLGEASVSVA